MTTVDDLQAAAAGDLADAAKELVVTLRDAESAEDETDVRANLREARKLAQALVDEIADLLGEEEA